MTGWREIVNGSSNMKKKIIFTALLITIGFLSFWPVADMQSGNSAVENGIQYSLSEKSRKILNVWAVLKVVNGVINVLQSAEIGGSFFVEASVNPLEFLSPVDNILDKLSDLLLWALGAVVMEKLILSISGLVVFKVIIPVCALLCVVTIWLQKEKTKLNRIIPVFVLLGLSISGAVPLSFWASSIIESKLFTGRVSNLIAEINDTGKDAEAMEGEVTGLKKIGKSILSFMTNAKSLADAIIEDMVDFVIIFLLTTIVIPILTVWGIIGVTKYFVKLLLGKG